MAHNLFIPAFLRLFAALTLSAAMLSSAAPLEHWHWRSPLPQGNPLRSVAYGNGLYVAVGDLGTILTSTDGTNWVRQNSGTTSGLRDCVYGGGQWVVVGDFGTVLTSTDTRSWTAQYPGTFFSLNAVIYENGGFVAAGDATTILTSSDAVSWTERSSGPWEMFDVVYEEGVYVAIGGNRGSANTAAQGVILTSSDTVSWTRRMFSVDATVLAITYGNGTFVVAARDAFGSRPALWISADGFSWEPRNLNVKHWPDYRLAYGDGTWVLAGSYTSSGFGGGAISLSTNLETWVEVVSNAPVVSAVSYQANRFIAACTDGALLISAGGEHWNNPLEEYSRDTLSHMQYVNGGWIGLAYDRLLGSADGAKWTNVVVFTNQNFDSFAYGNGVCVLANYWFVWTSSDLANWTDVTDAFPGTDYPGIVDVTFGDGLFVGISSIDGEVFASTDGSTWSRSSVLAPDEDIYLLSIAHGGGRFVAVGPEGFGTSTDGTNWHGVKTNSTSMSAVTWGNGRFVAVGHYGSMTTTDGTNWVSRRMPQFRASAIAFGGGFFVAVGSDFNSRSESPIWVSQDGLNWSYRNSQTLRTFRSIAFGNGKFVIGGSGGAILHSDPIVNLTVRLGPEPELTLSGPTGHSYRIDYADGPHAAWQPMRTLSLDIGSVTVSDTQGGPSRFYRAVMLPQN